MGEWKLESEHEISNILIDEVLVPDWVPDDVDFDRGDVFVEAHAVFYVFEESRAVWTSWCGQAHGDCSFAIFELDVVNEAEVDDAEIYFRINYFV